MTLKSDLFLQEEGDYTKSVIVIKNKKTGVTI